MMDQLGNSPSPSPQGQPSGEGEAPKKDIKESLMSAHDGLVNAIEGLQQAQAPKEIIGPFVELLGGLRANVEMLQGGGQQQQTPEGPIPENGGQGAMPAGPVG